MLFSPSEKRSIGTLAFMHPFWLHFRRSFLLAAFVSFGHSQVERTICCTIGTVSSPNIRDSQIFDFHISKIWRLQKCLITTICMF